MAVKYLSGNRLWGTNAERTGMTTTGSPSQTSWKEIARVTLSSSSATMDTGTSAGGDVITNTMYATPKENIMILYHGIYHSGLIQAKLQVGYNIIDDDGEYAYRQCRDGTEDGSGSVDKDQYFYFVDGADYSDEFGVVTIRNDAGLEKLAEAHGMNEGTSGSGNAPHRAECVGKWVNTSNQINRIQVTTANTFDAGSELVILGCDDDEGTSGTNFWQELGKAEQTTDARTIDTGTITAKKWLWVESSYKYTSGNDPYLQFNSDHASNYIYRRSMAGGTDSTSGATGGAVDNANTDYNFYDTNFIVNELDKEKLVICHTAHDASNTGADNAPARREWAGKWAEDGEQITSVQYYLDSTGNMQGYIKVWGSD